MRGGGRKIEEDWTNGQKNCEIVKFSKWERDRKRQEEKQ